jgi:hypothetical protein
MQRPTSKATNWAAKFDAMAKEGRGAPEPGYYTVDQWAKKLNRRHTQALRLCKQALADGAMEKQVYSVFMPSLGTRPIAHYRLIKGAR